MRQAFLKLHIAVLLAGTTGVLGKIISLSAEVLVWYRMLLALFVCYILFSLSGRFVKLPFAEIKRFLWIGALLALHWVFFYLSIKYSNVSVAVTSFSLGGFFTAIFEPLINRTKVQIAEVAISGLTVLGIALIFHFDTQFRLGIVFGVTCAVLVAFFAIANAKVIAEYSPETALFYNMLGGVVFLSIFLPFFFIFFPPATMMPTMTDIFCLLFLVIACTIGMLLLENQAMQYISPFTVNLTFNLEPLYSLVLAFLFLGEAKDMTFPFYCGIFFIFLSVCLQTLRTLRKKKQIDPLLVG